MKLKVSQAFNLTGRGITAFKKNVVNGLPVGTILRSEERNLQWRVKYRMIWMHSAHAVARFSNENENMGRASFDFSTDVEDPVEKAIESELKLGCEYGLEPIDHIEKPVDGEILIIQA